jgi:SAM-dependent methyltransferase
MESVPCPLCGGERRRPLLVAGDRLRPGDDACYRVVRCTDCGLAFTDPRPAADEMAAFYPPSYGGLEGDDLLARLEAGFRRRQQREVVRWLAALRPSRGRLLDAGCGAGDLLAALREDGWDVAGLEAAPQAAELARRRHGLEVTTGRFEDADLAGATFDVVGLAGVLEHLHDPLGALRTARALLRAGGLVAVLFVPRLDSPEARRFGRRWLALDLPRHLTHFDEATFTRMAAAAGLSITHREPYSSRHSAAQLVGSVAPGLQKHRFYALEAAGRPAGRGGIETAAAAITPVARRAAFIALTTAARPWCRLEAAVERGAVCSYFLEPTG